MEHFDFMRVIYFIVPVILSLTVHEYAHAWVAAKLGDDTATRMGRKTLNPIAHIDPIWTLLVPIIGIMSHGPVFGMAKPVPINPIRFTRKYRMKISVLMVALAGPISNIIFAVLLAVLLGVLRSSAVGLLTNSDKGISGALFMLAITTIQVNVTLFVFNLIPIPPLDGSKVLAGLLPDRFLPMFSVVEKYFYIFFIFILILGGAFLAAPVNWITDLLFQLTRLIIG
jgi:Zn-dependent proteases